MIAWYFAGWYAFATVAGTGLAFYRERKRTPKPRKKALSVGGWPWHDPATWAHSTIIPLGFYSAKPHKWPNPLARREWPRSTGKQTFTLTEGEAQIRALEERAQDLVNWSKREAEDNRMRVISTGVPHWRRALEDQAQALVNEVGSQVHHNEAMRKAGLALVRMVTPAEPTYGLPPVKPFHAPTNPTLYQREPNDEQ